MIGRLLRPRRGDDEGAGLLLVVGTSAVVMSLVLVSASIASRSLTSARVHDSFSASLAAAETGVDQGLARVQGAYDLNGSDYRTPHPTGTTYDSSPDCATAEVTFPTSAGVSNAAEAAWAKARLLALVNTSGCLKTGPNGQFVVLKPAGRQAVYAMGWSPKYSATARYRFVKAEYIFSPYKPSNAVLTGGDLEIDSSTTVTSATAGAAAQAAIHSNSNITVANGNPTVTGPVTQSGGGTLPSSNKFSSAASRSTTQTVPNIEARSVYGRNVANYPGAWFDLCSDGKARSGSTSGPCAGAVIGDYGSGGALAGGTFRNGWKYDGSTTPPTWQVTGGFLDGVYYASQSNVGMGSGVGNPSVNRATIIASSVGITCNKSGGNIDWNKVNIAAPYVSNLFMLADQDLRTGANFSAGSVSGSTVISGLFVTGDQVQMETSSSGAFGAVIAGDECDPSGSMVDANVIKNPSVYYDPTGYAPFTDVVNTTLWLEFTG